MKQAEKDIFERAMALCSRSEKSPADLRQSMTRWGLKDIASQEKIIALLKENNFISEDRYARSYVLDKHRFNSWGKIKISHMLRAKGISDINIQHALESIPGEVYIKTLRKGLLNKRKSIKASNNYELKSKLMRFAQSRGFESELINKVIDEILG